MLAGALAFLYAFQWWAESLDLSTEVARPCYVLGVLTENRVCYRRECDTQHTDECYTAGYDCYQNTYRVSLTLTGLSALGTTTPQGEYATHALAAAAAGAVVGRNATCFFHGSLGSLQFQPTTPTTSWIPIVVFGAAYLVCAACACGLKRVFADEYYDLRPWYGEPRSDDESDGDSEHGTADRRSTAAVEIQMNPLRRDR